MLRVVNARLGADFDPDAFEHVAFYDRGPATGSRCGCAPAAPMARPRPAAPACDRGFAGGDEIRTEISCKYTRERLRAHARRAPGSSLEAWHTDPGAQFAVTLLRRTN